MSDDIIITNEGKMIFNPYNSNNKEITEEELSNILKSYGLPNKIYNINLYKRAFVHKSYTKRSKQDNEDNQIEIMPRPINCLELKQKSNERLEFLGDGIVEAITKYYLYKRFPKENEGFMTEKKIALVKNESLGKLAYDMNLNKWLLLSKHAEEKKSRTNLKKLGCLFEAFIAAVFLDTCKLDIKDEFKWFEKLFSCGPGFQMTQVLLENIYERHINWSEIIENDDNYKNILQVKIQKEFKTTPYYIEKEYDQDNGYYMGVYLYIGYQAHELKSENAYHFDDKIYIDEIKTMLNNKKKVFIFLGESKHKIKKKAEQMACLTAIKLLK